MRPRPLRSNTVVSAKSAGKNADDRDDAEHHACRGLQRRGQKADQPVAEENEDLVELLDHAASAAPPSAGSGAADAGRGVAAWLPAARRRGGLGCGSFGRGLRLGFNLGLFLGQARIHFRRFGGMNRVVVLVRLRQLLAVVAAARQSGRRCSAQTRYPS